MRNRETHQTGIVVVPEAGSTIVMKLVLQFIHQLGRPTGSLEAKVIAELVHIVTAIRDRLWYI